DGHGEFVDADERHRVDAFACIVGTAFAKLCDVGAGCEDPSGSGEDEEARFGLKLIAHLVQRIDRALVDRVTRFRSVQRHDDAVGTTLDAQSLTHVSRSTIIAEPWPTPTH